MDFHQEVAVQQTLRDQVVDESLLILGLTFTDLPFLIANARQLKDIFHSGFSGSINSRPSERR